MKSTKITSTILLLFVLMSIGKTQNCYSVIADMSGVDTNPYQTELETTACELKAAFPVELQNQFKVFDFGSYSFNEKMEGGFQNIWEKVVQDIEEEFSFYVIFGKESDSRGVYSKFWFDMKLPQSSFFSCLDDTDIQQINLQVMALLNAGNYTNVYDYANKEIEAMIYIKAKISCQELCFNGIDDDGDGWTDCNDPDCYEGEKKKNKQGHNKNLCKPQALFVEYSNQKFGFDDNKIKSYPTYSTPLGDGIPWKSLGVGVEDQVTIKFSSGAILQDITYQATGVEILSGNTPQGYEETITIKSSSVTNDAKIKVLDIDGNVIGGLMVVVLPAKEMILNLVLMKRPEDADYPNVNFTIPDMTEVMNNTFKQINMSWTVNPIDNYEWGFDENNDLKLDEDETYNIYSHVFEKEPILLSKWFPSDDTKISTYFLYTFIKDENGFTFEEDMFGAVSSGYQHNKRTMAHENGHRIGYNHPWEDEQNNGYKLYDDADA